MKSFSRTGRWRGVGMLVCAALACLTACGAAPASENATSAVNAQAAERSPEKEQAALDAATEYFTAVYQDVQRYAVCEAGMFTVATPEQYFADVEWQADAVDTAISDSVPAGAYLERPEVYLVRVDFYTEYNPEILYLGPQYSDGNIHVYILVEPGRTVQISGWLASSDTAAHPVACDEAKALGLTQRQYLMLTHQTASLYAAGLQSFSDPADLTNDQLARYIAVRAADGFAIPDCDGQTALMIANIDFTDEADVWNSQTVFTLEQMAFTAEQRSAAPPEERLPLTWHYANEDGVITAAGADGEGVLRQRYTFRTHTDVGNVAWTSRTYCVSGEAF